MSGTACLYYQKPDNDLRIAAEKPIKVRCERHGDRTLTSQPLSFFLQEFYFSSFLFLCVCV